MKPQVLALGNFSGPTKVALAEHFTLHHFIDVPDIADALSEEQRSAIVAVANEPNRPVSAHTISLLPQLKIISVCGMGTDAVDLAAARARDVPVAITPNVLGDEVGDLAIGLMLASARQIVYADRYVREGLWLKGHIPLGRSVGGKTMGVVGLGGIGRAIADRGAAFKMRVIYHGPRAKTDAPYEYFSDLVEMARQSDYLMIACPGGPATAKLVSRQVIEALGPTGTLVNVARGSVVDEAALITALQSGALGFAALDVFENEPNVAPALLQLPNVIVQPHQGSATVETRTRMGMAMLENILTEIGGTPAPGRLR